MNGTADYAEKPWARSADKRGPEPAMPLWVRALDAWCQYTYPLGAPGRSAAQAVVREVEKHVRREIKTARRRR